MSEQSDPTTTTTPLRKVLGEKTAKALATHLDLHTAGDLIYHFPRRYDERGEHTDMRDLRIGEQVTLLAQVQSVSVKPMRARRGNMLEITVGDGSGATLTCTFFNQAWRERELRRGRWGLFAGKITDFRGKRQLNGIGSAEMWRIKTLLRAPANGGCPQIISYTTHARP